ncbi:MAG TPA: citrate/2-methylcitrate synthase [Polyangiaceae bacterium]|jgi:citrate synthase|nr:citrate/2-methylcitrate synthase [Polyangiaceae bacterium]
MKRNVLTARQVATRLGVKLETVYAYVSRGVLQRTLADDGRTSRFDASEVDSLARHGRPRSGAARVGTVDVSLATSITEIHGDRLLFRGQDAIALARTSSFEAVAELLWSGSMPPSQPVWPSPPIGARVARKANAALPASTSPIERLAVITAALACAHPLRTDLRPATVAAHGRAMLATFVELLPEIRGAASRLSPDEPLARRLWPRLSALAATAERVAVLDDALVLLSDHELATSTLAARVAASARADPFAVVLAGLGAVSGPLHGKAALAVHEMLLHAAASSPELAFAQTVGEMDGNRVTYGFGHPVYRGVDPRAAHLLEVLGPLARREDRRLFDAVLAVARSHGAPHLNVDFALGALAFALKMPLGATEAIFAVARAAGWLAHALEEYGEAPLRFRARAVYIGPAFH